VAEQLLDVAQVGLADVADANAGALSHGEHRQLEPTEACQ
jgi:ABC-type branched-subunit amino acid transport system ATPase component